MIKQVIALQDEVNTITIGSNWREKEVAWTFALTQETAELIDSLKLKWWKDTGGLNIKDLTYDEVLGGTNPDFDNILIEVVDLLHFLISYYQIQFTNDEIEDIFTNATSGESATYNKVNCIATYKKQVFLAARAFIKNFTVINFIELCKAAELDIEKVYEIYIAKNILNRFRQDNGYKNGTYKKVWFGKEDNQVMLEYISNGTTLDNLYNQLENIYRKV